MKELLVLFDEVVDDHLLVAVKPAGQGNYDEVERLYGVCHCTNNLAAIFFDNNIMRLVRIFAPYGPKPGHLSKILGYCRPRVQR